MSLQGMKFCIFCFFQFYYIYPFLGYLVNIYIHIYAHTIWHYFSACINIKNNSNKHISQDMGKKLSLNFCVFFVLIAGLVSKDNNQTGYIFNSTLKTTLVKTILPNT